MYVHSVRFLHKLLTFNNLYNFKFLSVLVKRLAYYACTTLLRVPYYEAESAYPRYFVMEPCKAFKRKGRIRETIYIKSKLHFSWAFVQSCMQIFNWISHAIQLWTFVSLVSDCLCTTIGTHISNRFLPFNSHLMIVFINTLTLNIWWRFFPVQGHIRFGLLPTFKSYNFPFQNWTQPQTKVIDLSDWFRSHFYSQEAFLMPRRICVHKQLLFFHRTEIKAHQHRYFLDVNDEWQSLLALAQA